MRDPDAGFFDCGEQILTAADNLAEAALQSGESTPRSSARILSAILGGEPNPSASTLFNAFVHPGRPDTGKNALYRNLSRRFEVLAVPGHSLSNVVLYPGDLLVRVARGEQWGHIAFIASQGLYRLEQLAQAGLRGEGYPAPLGGWYVHVVEIRPRPRASRDRFARRIGDFSGLVLPDTLLLRPVETQWPTDVESEGGGSVLQRGAAGATSRSTRELVAEAGGVPGPCPDIVEPHRRLSTGSQNPSAREAQRKLNLFHASELAAGRPGLDGCPLTPDCIFGSRTLWATRSFQQRVFPNQPGEWDGIIGPKTWRKLDLVQPPGPVPPVPPIPRPPGPVPPAIVFDTNPQSWFLDAAEIAAARGNAELNRTLRVFTTGNLVQPLIDGEAYMQSLHDDLIRTGRGDFFHFTAWRLNITQDLVPPGVPSATSPTRFDNVVRAAAARGMTPSALIWKALAAGFTPSSVAGMIGENTAARNFFNSVGGKGVIDGRYPKAGAHHQKTAVVLRAGEAVAYCGGIDICPDRWDTPSHSSDPRRTKEHFEGWHDVHVRLRGPAVLDIEQNFRDRWNDSEPPSSIPSEPSPPPITTPLPPVASSPGTHNVQILRTYACIKNFLIPTTRYDSFAPRGEFTILAGYLKAIARARNYIYIEDQYLVSEELARALGRALSRANKLIILVPRDTDGYPPAAFNWHQERFLSIVRGGHPAKVHVYHPVRPATGNPIYVHAKLMIIDDIYAVVGSPNVNRRGGTHDAEIAAAVVDSDVVGGVCRYARDLRRSLWGEHLNLPPSDARIADPIVGVAEWERQAAAGTFRVRRHITPTPQSQSIWWDSAADPDGRCTRPAAPLVAGREAGEAEMEGKEFIEAADLILTERAGETPPESFFHDLLSQTGLIWALVVPETGEILTPAEVFDAFAREAESGLHEQLKQVFEVIALPSTVLEGELDEGDILIQRLKGDAAEVALVATPALLDLGGVATAGLAPETLVAGEYAHVVEGGVRPQAREDAFAKRVTDPNGITLGDVLILRIRPDMCL